MAIEWFYQTSGFEQGPVSSEQLRVLAGQGAIDASTPVQRSSGDERTPWRRAGEVKGLFTGDVSGLLGDPICGNCGKRLAHGRCLSCDPAPAVPPAAVTPPPAVTNDSGRQSSRGRYPELHRYLDFCKGTADILFWGTVILIAFALFLALLDTSGRAFASIFFTGLLAIAGAYLARLLILASVQVTYVLLDIEANTRKP